MAISITARLGLDAAKFQRDLSEVQARAVTAAKDIEAKVAAAGAQKKGGILGADIGGGLGGAGLAAGGVLAAVKSTIDYAGALNDSASSLGVNVVALQELDYAFGQSGASASDVTKSLSKLGQTAEAALGGNEGLQKSFAELGVSLKDLERLTPDQLLMKIGDASKESDSPAKTLAATIDVMGKSGLKMAAGLKEGTAGIAGLRAEAETLSEETIDALDRTGDRLSKMANRVKGGAGLLLEAILNPGRNELQRGDAKSGPVTASELEEAIAAKNARVEANKEQREVIEWNKFDADLENKKALAKRKSDEDHLKAVETGFKKQADAFFKEKKHIAKMNEANNEALRDAQIKQKADEAKAEGHAKQAAKDKLEGMKEAVAGQKAGLTNDNQFSVGELAGGRGFGKAGSDARRILNLEERARRAFARGNINAGRDFQSRANDLQNALNDRRGIKADQALPTLQSIATATEETAAAAKAFNLANK